MPIKLNVAIRVPEEAPREFDLSFDKSVITIGRDRENDVQIPLGTVSRRHARIYKEHEEWFIEDLRSTHGTKVNGQILGLGGRKLLRDADQIQIVYAFITFHQISGQQLEETATTDEKTSVVARKMVQEVLEQKEDVVDVPRLIVMNGPLQGKAIDFGPNVTELVLGRGDNCDVRLDDTNISRRHAVIHRDWNEFSIEDLGSKNGVVVNGQKISGKVRLKDADEIYLGATHLTFVDPEANLLGKLGQIPAFASEAKTAEVNVAAPLQKESEAIEEPNQAEAKGFVPVSTETVKKPSSDTNVTAPSSMAIVPERRFGAFEYMLLLLVGLVVVGLVVGVIIALE